MIAAATLAAVAFGLTYYVEHRLYDLRVFHNWDVWFQADPNTALWGFAKPPGFSIRHPSIALLVYWPFALVARLVGAIQSFGDPLPEAIVLLIAPVATSLRTLVSFDLFRRLTKRVWPAVLLAVLDLCGFASVTVGSVPESFVLTALSLSAAYWLVVDDVERPAWFRIGAWIAVGTVAVGITITNMIPITILMVGRLQRDGWSARRTAGAVLTTGITALLLNSAMVFAGARQFRYALSATRTVQTTRVFMNPPSAAHVGQLGWALSHSILAPLPGTVPSWASDSLNPNYHRELSFRPPYEHEWSSYWRSAITLLMLAFGAVGFHRSQDARHLLILPAAILAFNLTLHSFYGASSGYMLYAPHWSLSLVFIVAGVSLDGSPWRRYGDAILAAFALVTAVNSWFVLEGMFAMLHGIFRA